MSFRTSVLLLSLTILSMSLKAEEKNKIKIGGALRFNLFDKSWIKDATQPEFTWDTWRLNADGSIGGIDLSFEYRFYPNSNLHFMHHGYFGYAFNEDLYMKLGVSQVPFGIDGFASHSYFFQGQYYFGLEDDYDLGLNFRYSGIENLDIDFAYFRSAEPQGHGGESSRYSYDIVSSANASIKEQDQFNLRLNYLLGGHSKLGASAQIGGIYNSALDKSEWSDAYALHLHSMLDGGWSIKATALTYNYKARDNNNQIMDIVQMGAYGAPYDVAAKANSYSVGLAKTFITNWGPINSIEAHVDYAYVDKKSENFYDTQQLIPGFLVTAGPMYIYIDYAMGLNHPWFTPNFGDGLGVGDADAEWMQRFNMNFGYYF